MLKASGCEITKFLFCQFIIIATAISFTFGSAQEEKSSYYLIAARVSERCKLTQVEKVVDEERCVSLCNRKDGCTGVIYNKLQEDTGSCFMKLDRKPAMKDKTLEISKGEKILLFRKLGLSFDFKERKFSDLGSSFGKECGYRNEEQTVTPPRSCKDIYETNRSAANGVYSVWPDGNNGQKEEVYCNMSKNPGCGEGGWTLVIKIDGKKSTFFYTSRKWTNKESFNPSSALNGLDQTELVSPAYWTIPLTKLCLGMRKQSEMNWIVLPVAPAQSLHSLIAGLKVISTNLGRSTWESLLSNSSLQRGCEREGFNSFINNQKVRIGMVAGTSCTASGSSVIGFGSTTRVASGNYRVGYSYGGKELYSFGYILVK